MSDLYNHKSKMFKCFDELKFGLELTDIFNETFTPLIVKPDHSSYEDKNNLKDLEDIPNNTTEIIIENFNNGTTWNDLDNYLKKQSSETLSRILSLYLGHDGMIYGEKKDFEEVLTKLPNLRSLSVCGYYHKNTEDLENTLIEKYNGKVYLKEII